MSFKSSLLKTVRDELERQIDQMRIAAGDAYSAATDPDSKAESKYDTRSLEASYLAQGQARQLKTAMEEQQLLQRFEIRDFEMDDQIAVGALVETDLDDQSEWFLLLPAGGGLNVTHQDYSVTTLSPSSRLYQLLIDHHMGDFIEETGHLITEIA